jgi:hypothetical protein
MKCSHPLIRKGGLLRYDTAVDQISIIGPVVGAVATAAFYDRITAE